MTNSNLFKNENKPSLFLFLLNFPVIIGTCIAIMYMITNDFWPLLLATTGCTIICLIIANRKSLYGGFKSVSYLMSNSGMVFRNLLIIIYGGLLPITLSIKNNLNQNHFSLVLIIIAVLITVGSIVLLAINKELYGMEKSKRNFFAGTNKIIMVPVTAFLLSMIYINFGSQFIWIPIIIMIVFYGFLFEDSDIRDLLNAKENTWRTYGLILIITGLISTFIQFWSEISNFFVMIFTSTLFTMWGYQYKVWELVAWMLGFGTILILFKIFINKFGEEISDSFIYIFAEIKKLIFYKKERARKEIQMQKDAENKELIEKENKTRENRKQKLHEDAIDVIAIVKSGDRFSWTHVFRISTQFGQESKEILSLTSKIWKGRLYDTEILEISELKKQIVYGSNFQLALQIIEIIARKTYEDDYLKGYIHQLKELIDWTENMEDYKGYSDMMHEIKTRCKTIWILLEEQQRKFKEKDEVIK